MNLDLTEAQRVLACLGDPSRFRIVAVLAEADRCVTEIAAEVGLSQSCTTRHLQVLLRRDVVSRVRQGKRVHFRLRDDDPAMALLLEWAMLRSPTGGPSEAGGAERNADASRPAPEYRAVAPAVSRSMAAGGSPDRQSVASSRWSDLKAAASGQDRSPVDDVLRPRGSGAGASATAAGGREADETRGRSADAERAGGGPERPDADRQAEPPAIEAGELEDYLL
jgi:DNA-binding transcriptional ArsR family regulator